MYSSLIEKIYKNTDGGIKLGLESVRKLDELLHFPSQKFRSIHIAGTNGKGSVALKIAEAFFLSGYKVGLFTSPHLISFRERILINGKPVSEETIEKALSHILEILDVHKVPATFFEITTLLAFDLFSQAKVDFAVIETGLGGRLDATNIIKPLLSIITSIGFDHMHFLGNTLEKIAYEKGGIIKKGVPLFVGPHADLEAVRKKADSLCCFYHVSKQEENFFDRENSFLAQDALHYLRKRISIKEKAIEKGITKRPPCRFELHTEEENKISEKFKKLPKALIFDVAHNESALLSLFKAIRYKFKDIPIRAIVGMSKDKDLDRCSKIISSNCSFIHLIDTCHERLISKEELARYYPKEKISYKEKLASTLIEAFEKAHLNNEILLVCGSFFIMKEVREFLLEGGGSLDGG